MQLQLKVDYLKNIRKEENRGHGLVWLHISKKNY